MLTRTLALAAAVAAFHSSLLAQCGIDTNYGATLTLADDAVSPPQALGFAFPFAGANYDTVYVVSNGFVYLFDSAGTVPPPTAARCCAGNVAGLLSSTSPMVCPLWQDLNPAVGGSVHFNAVPGKAIITWLAVPEYGQTNAITVQLVLYSSGVIEMAYGTTANRTHAALVGWSPGNGAADPGGSDLSALPVIVSSNTVYELFQATTLDLRDTQLQANPSGASGWIVVPVPGCAASVDYGTGCPRRCDVYEQFAASGFDLSATGMLFTRLPSGAYSVTTCSGGCFDTNFTNALSLTDDSLATGLSLGFVFPFCGGSSGTIDVCSNGFVWLNSGSTLSTDFSPTAAEFFAQPARLAPLWMDLNPANGGGVYFDVFANKAMVTWNQVPAYGVTGSSNTFQLQLFPNGDFIVSWVQALNNQTTGGSLAISGVTPGGTSDPGSTDLSASVPFTTGAGVPMRLTAQAGSRPVIGTTFTLEASNVRTGTSAASLSIGASNPNLDLTFLGMPGCTWLSTMEVILPFVATPPVATVALPIPNQRSLVNRTLHTQVLMIDLSLVPGVPAYLSNGVLLTLGN